jgi:hypothetical protein
MRAWIPLVPAMTAGLLAGVGSAFWILSNGQLLGSFEQDYWFGNDRAGSVAADPYTRGIIANIGLLALNKSETIYFHRYRDEKGRQLRESCTYELRGAVIPARWWSITVYASDSFLPVNGHHAYSVDATRVVSTTDGAWATKLSSERGGDANWISTKSAGSFSLGLRMYNPEVLARNDSSSIPFPTIKTLSCHEGPP